MAPPLLPFSAFVALGVLFSAVEEEEFGLGGGGGACFLGGLGEGREFCCRDPEPGRLSHSLCRPLCVCVEGGGGDDDFNRERNTQRLNRPADTFNDPSLQHLLLAP